jgi:hypothetical protein
MGSLQQRSLSEDAIALEHLGYGDVESFDRFNGWRIVRGLRRAVALSRDAHLSDDRTVAKMGHPGPARTAKGFAWLGARRWLKLRDGC